MAATVVWRASSRGAPSAVCRRLLRLRRCIEPPQCVHCQWLSTRLSAVDIQWYTRADPVRCKWSHTRHQHGLYLPGCRRCGHYHHQPTTWCSWMLPRTCRTTSQARMQVVWRSTTSRSSSTLGQGSNLGTGATTIYHTGSQYCDDATTQYCGTFAVSSCQPYPATQSSSGVSSSAASSSAQSSSSSAAVSSSATPSSSSSSSAAAAVPSSSSQPAFSSSSPYIGNLTVCQFAFSGSNSGVAGPRLVSPWCSRASSSTTLHRAASMCPLPVAIDSAISC